MKRLVIVDPQLRSSRDRSLIYNHAVIGVAEEQGCEVVTLVSDQCRRDLACRLACIPCFRERADESTLSHLRRHLREMLRRDRLTRAQARFAADLHTAGDRVPFDASTTVLVPGTTAAQIPAFVRWLEGFSAVSRPELLLMLRSAPAPDPFVPCCRSARSWRRALARIENSRVRGSIRLFTDSEVLRREFASLSRLPVVVAPIPQPAVSAIRPSRLPERRIVTYVGTARRGRGFHYLSHVARQLAGRFAAGDWSAEFQAHVVDPSEGECLWVRSELRRLPVSLYEEEFSAADYQHALARSSLVLLPYSHVGYYAETSGILADAISRGKPVVVPRGTWLAGQIKDRGVGQTFVPGDRLSLADAVAAAMDQIDEHTRAAQDLAGEWLLQHNPQAFFKTVTNSLAA